MNHYVPYILLLLSKCQLVVELCEKNSEPAFLKSLGNFAL